MVAVLHRLAYLELEALHFCVSNVELAAFVVYLGFAALVKDDLHFQSAKIAILQRLDGVHCPALDCYTVSPKLLDFEPHTLFEM